MHYLLIAGETSGDVHGALLVEALRARDPQARFTFCGGDAMTQAVGHEPVINCRQMAFMGITAVLRNLGAVRRNFATVKQALQSQRPDCVVLIDYPGFNMRVAKMAKSMGIPVIYYILPKLWAWRPWRARKLQQFTDLRLSILPFEVEYFKKEHGIDVVYVGNPTVAEIDEAKKRKREEAGLEKTERVIALLPGSRIGEIRANLPIMVQAVRQFPQYKAVVSAAPGVDRTLYAELAPGLEIAEPGTSTALLMRSRAALVTSGTATLEAAVVGTPQVALYRSNGSKLTYQAMKPLMHIDYVTLPNLIAGRAVIAELLMHLCTADAAAEALGRITGDGPERQVMLDGYADIARRLGRLDAPANAATAIAYLLGRKRATQ